VKTDEYELRLVEVIKTIRKMNGLKQLNLCKDIGISESAFCKIEKGQQVISLRQLRDIAEALKTSYIHMLFFAESDQLKYMKLKPLSAVLLDYFLKLQNSAEDIGHSEEEIESLIDKIRESHK